MRILDLFCGAGLAADGYAAAGFEVIGVDIRPQPNYPYEFIQADALLVLSALVNGNNVVLSAGEWQYLGTFDAVHASPPCQLFSRAGKLRDAQGGVSTSLDLLTPTIAALQDVSVPWIIENVEDAKPLMPGAVRLCGSSFGLEVQRHRLFLSNIPIDVPSCDHAVFPLDPITNKPRPWGIYHVPGDSIPSGGRTARNADHARDLMGLTRDLSWNEIKEGIPPAYTSLIGNQIITALTAGD